MLSILEVLLSLAHLNRLFHSGTIFYGILKLKQMQAAYDANLPQKAAKEKDAKES